jgi:polygalacturonase
MHTIDIREHGAVADGATINTAAIQAAITTAAKEGGTVFVPRGEFLTGSLQLLDGTTLYLEGTLKASPNPDDFVAVSDNPRGNRHLIWAMDASHITISGPGHIDGNRQTYDDRYETPYQWTGARTSYRPMLHFGHCRHVRLEGFSLAHSVGWTIRFENSEQLWITDIHLYNHVFAGNADGIDMCGVRDVTIRGCHIETADDALVFKTLKHTRSCERVTISDCIIRTSCAAVRLGAETWHNYKQFVIQNLVVHNSSRAIDIISRDGCVIEDITVSNLVIDTDSSITMNRAIHLEARKGRSEWTHPGEKSLPLDEQVCGTIRNVLIENVVLRTDGRIMISATDGGRLHDIVLRGIHMIYPWIEDPHQVRDLSDQRQSSNFCPEVRLAHAAVAVKSIHRFQISDLTITWPQGPAPADMQPKYEHGKLAADPHDQNQPLPAFHAIFAQDLTASIIDCPLAEASTPDGERYHLIDCDLRRQA